MDDTKTLLQQIRDKEQEVNLTVEEVRKETEAMVAAAKTEAEKILQDTEQRGKLAAEELTRSAGAKIEAEIDQLKKVAAADGDQTKTKGNMNKDSAIETILRHVTMR